MEMRSISQITNSGISFRLHRSIAQIAATHYLNSHTFPTYYTVIVEMNPPCNLHFNKYVHKSDKRNENRNYTTGRTYNNYASFLTFLVHIKFHCSQNPQKNKLIKIINHLLNVIFANTFFHTVPSIIFYPQPDNAKLTHEYFNHTGAY